MSERTALLLDDNLMTTARVRSQLEKAGYHVQTARRVPASKPENGQGFALIIINLGSRSLPGIELIKSSLELFPASRVLGFCGHAEVEIRRQAKQAGLRRILTNDEALQDLANALGDTPQDDVKHV